ncbi:DNA-3-methyladenine glycosylase I [Prevotella disiens]|uniref:DNA-3-methyladenine glycosylase I n=1 Tax=Prevotella disiens TaxID=28130 RepID=UPI00288A7A86|nr:DNA-3-methyladenine glycosylase I [Prevotella disiens]
MITNEQAFLRIIEDFGSFDKYIWHFARSKTMVYPSQQKHLCTHNALSNKVAKDLKKRGFKYVGSVIIYS